MTKTKTNLQNVNSVDDYINGCEDLMREKLTNMIAESIKNKTFDDVDDAVEGFNKLIDIVVLTETPIAASKEVTGILSEYTIGQKILLLKHLLMYIDPNSVFFDEEWNQQEETYQIFKSILETLVEESRVNLKGISSMKVKLCQMMEKEIQEMPNRLNNLDDQQRLTVVMKILPYIMGKVEEGEQDVSSVWQHDYL